MEEIKVGDYVQIKTGELSNWTSSMDIFKGAILKVESFYGGNIYFHNEESKSYFWQVEFHVEKKVTEESLIGKAEREYQASLALLEEKRKKEEEERKKLEKSYIFKGVDVLRIAKDVYGEERVDLITEGSAFSIIVHYPEILIKNSKGRKHVIKDLYVKIYVSSINIKGERKASINIYGCRRTMSLAEWGSDYSHSHISGRKTDFSSFCLGHSEFGTELNNLGMTLTEDGWYMIFFGLDKYVEWESLEGGPYRTIENITERDTIVSGSDILREANRLFGNIPPQVFNYSKGLELIEDHPLLIEYYEENSQIKSLKNTISSERVEEIEKSNKSNFLFKGKNVPLKIITESKVIPDQLSGEVVKRYNDHLKDELRKFNNNYIYDKSKRANHEKVFKQVGIIQ